MDLGELSYEGVDDFDEELEEQEQYEEDLNEYPELNEEVEDNSEELSSAIQEYLKDLGINDINKIKFETEDGLGEEERSWKDLTKEELLNILRSGKDDPEKDLDDDELDLINRIRLSQMTPKLYMETIQQQGIAKYAQELKLQEEPSYLVDDISDDELYMLDLQAKIPDITDEELEQALETAKSNPLYDRLIQALRNEYKNLEEEKKAQTAATQLQEEQEKYEQFSNGIVNAIQNFTDFGDLNIGMTSDDMDELASFILDRDDTGTSYFGRALNDPDALVRMAYMYLHGEDVLNSVSDYFKQLISSVSKSSYQKGLEAGKKGTSQSKVVVTKKPLAKTNRMAKSIDDFAY